MKEISVVIRILGYDSHCKMPLSQSYINSAFPSGEILTTFWNVSTFNLWGLMINFILGMPGIKNGVFLAFLVQESE